LTAAQSPLIHDPLHSVCRFLIANQVIACGVELAPQS
jgi:hypothetical protein